jgi:hypothetical protein
MTHKNYSLYKPFLQERSMSREKFDSLPPAQVELLRQADWTSLGSA